MKKINVVALVSTDKSDIYFANRLIKEVNVVGVVVENQYLKPKTSEIILKGLKYFFSPMKVLQKIYDYRDKAEHYKRTAKIKQDGFCELGKELKYKESIKVRYTRGKMDINDPSNVEWIKSLKPDLITVCGTSILKEPILKIPKKGVLNLHGGLSQYYRGVWTTLWAVYNEEPEYVGCTLHYVSPGIDDGDIIFQARPEISEDDNPESLYVKVVKKGVELMIRAVEDIERGKIQRTKLKKPGTLYLKKRVTPKVLKECWKKIDAGVVKEYLKNKDMRDKKVEIIG